MKRFPCLPQPDILSSILWARSLRQGHHALQLVVNFWWAGLCERLQAVPWIQIRTVTDSTVGGAWKKATTLLSDAQQYPPGWWRRSRGSLSSSAKAELVLVACSWLVKHHVEHLHSRSRFLFSRVPPEELPVRLCKLIPPPLSAVYTWVRSTGRVSVRVHEDSSCGEHYRLPVFWDEGGEETV